MSADQAKLPSSEDPTFMDLFPRLRELQTVVSVDLSNAAEVHIEQAKRDGDEEEIEDLYASLMARLGEVVDLADEIRDSVMDSMRKWEDSLDD